MNIAIIGSKTVINGGELPTSGADLASFHFTNLAPGAVNTANLAAFDTVVLNVASPEMGCDVNTLSAQAKADLVAFLCGPGTDSVTGTSFLMDGGWTAA